MSKTNPNKFKMIKPYIDMIQKNAFGIYIIGLFGTFSLSVIMSLIHFLYIDYRLFICTIIIIYLRSRNTRLVLVND